MALADGSSQEKGKPLSELRTEPNLKIPVSTERQLDSEIKELLEKYFIKKPALANRQRNDLLKILDKRKEAFAQFNTDPRRGPIGTHAINIFPHTHLYPPDNGLQVSLSQN
jgi:hypothetical protein